ncbi:11019_t:CDS:1, partial [Ambispora gerdemannii]
KDANGTLIGNSTSILKVDVQNSNYTWVPVPDLNQTNPTPEKGKNIGGIVGGVIGGILGAVILVFVIYMYKQKDLKSDNEVIQQPTSEPITNDTNNQVMRQPIISLRSPISFRSPIILSKDE